MESFEGQAHSSWTRSFGWRRALSALCVRKAPRRLRLCESVSLGEKRLVAVVEYDQQKFLVGGSAQSISLLARLGEQTDFADLMTAWCERQR